MAPNKKKMEKEEKEVHPSNELKRQFLMAACNQLEMHANAVAELGQSMLESKGEPLLDMQESDVSRINASTLTFLNLIERLRKLDVEQLTSLVTDTLAKVRTSADSLKSQFLPSLGHELRTPINSITGFSHVILKGVNGPINEVQSAALTSIKKRGEMLLYLINQFFDVWRIEEYRAGNDALYTFEAVKPKEIIESVISQLKKEIEIEACLPDNLPIVWADERGLFLMLSYAASALSANLKQGKLICEATLADDKLNIRVRQKDFALADTVLAKFERVVAADTLFAHHRFDETLDLCISRFLVEIHGGEMEIGNQEGCTVATLTLPSE
jgi:K+-sensing histidine kinase KdpD